MLSRRHLRKRALQVLYAFYQSEERDLKIAEKQLLHGIDRTEDLIYFLLDFLPSLAAAEHRYIADAPRKLLQGDTPARRRTLEENVLVDLLSKDATFRKSLSRRHMGWDNDAEQLVIIFNKVRKSEEYESYIARENVSPEDECAFAVTIFKNHLVKSDSFRQYIEEKNIFWADGFPFATEMTAKILKSVKPAPAAGLVIPTMFRDERDDKAFLHKLLFETARNDSYFESLIRDKARNWDLDRIAMVDMILMKMTLAEILNVESIPVKVSINEYLEIAKEFSTPKSRIFINGIIDKLVMDLRSENKILKTGRGLVE